MRISKPCYQKTFGWYPYLAIGGARQYASRESSAIVCNYAQQKARNPKVQTRRREEVQRPERSAVYKQESIDLAAPGNNGGAIIAGFCCVELFFFFCLPVDAERKEIVS